MTVRSEVVSVEFACSNYQRIASIPPPEFSSDVIRVKPLWKTIDFPDSDIMVNLGLFPLFPGVTDNLINLRWYDSEPVYNGNSFYQIQKSGFLVRKVEVYYVSVQLDRQDKLESLGV